MDFRRRGLGLFGLLVVAVLGATVFTSSAQALVPKFLVGKKVVAEGLNASFEGEQIGRSTFSVPALSVEFNCEKLIIEKGVITSSTNAEAEFIYQECSVLEAKAPLGEIPCAVNNGKRIILASKILPAELKNGNPALLFESIKALVGLEGAECPLPLDTSMSGEFCAKIFSNETVEPTLESSEAIQGECRARSTLGGAEITSGTQAEIEKLEKEGKAFLDKMSFLASIIYHLFKSKVHLKGPHLGLTLGVLLQ